MNEIGVDPGIDHMSAMRVLDDIRERGGKIHSFKSFCGGLVAPESDNNPWNYKFTWNPRNVVLAGQGAAACFEEETEYKYIPYNTSLVLLARELRKNATETEKIFWDKVLKNKKLKGLKFTRQKPLGNFIADFYCAKLGVIIEIDGEIHNFSKTRDAERDNLLVQEFGLKIVRYKKEEVLFCVVQNTRRGVRILPCYRI